MRSSRVLAASGLVWSARRHSLRTRAFCTAALLCVLGSDAAAQVTKADYERAQGLREKYRFLTTGVADGAAWIGKTNRFTYRRSVAGGYEFVVVDADTRQKQPAFDHERLAAALGKATGGKHTAVRLPFNNFTFADDERGIEMSIEQERWRCNLQDYSCKKNEPPPLRAGMLRGFGGPVRNPDAAPEIRPRTSPDGKWEAVVQNYNLAIRPVGANGKPTVLSRDGSEGNYYDLGSATWSPDSKKIAAYRVRPGYRRLVHYVESSPEDQLQPKHSTLAYTKPGDAVDLDQPVVFHVDPARQLAVANDLFPNPYTLSRPVWRKDGRTFTFEYNQRGHQVFRVIEVDAESGRARAVISEEPKTFFYYNAARSDRQSGKKFRNDVDDGKEVVWMTERDGWNHLYLIDGATGAVKNQITKGEWAVRGVEKVDEEKRQIWFSATGTRPGEDPYFLHFFRINFDGSGLTPLTAAPADHEVKFSSDMKYFVDTYSRVDLPPVLELRKSEDGSLVAELEKGDIRELVKAGWKPPEVFTAKGRDGKTDIWGVIFRPTSVDPKKKYPVIESIYAGPHGSHVPKSWSAYSQMQAQAELGFVVVQIDGMGTSNRSKAFHDVAWRNLKDAGFPDRILWHQAVAKKYPYYDITRLGIYGGSAGGQNAMGALLFHPQFYKAAVAYAGCHDNRMDKIWWNEQWMGWPIGPHYSESSNVDNAARLQGRLLLVVGEMDTNVDPSSTMQVVNALLKAKKDFELLVIPGGSHGAGRGGEHGPYGERKRFDFFVRHLLGQPPPDWNKEDVTPVASAGSN
jgi:dipeptidyl aminopeptidase/acylaminoacyl peptidase